MRRGYMPCDEEVILALRDSGFVAMWAQAAVQTLERVVLEQIP